MLHDWRIDDREYARHESRRGRRHAYELLVPGRTALVVVDMVPFFVEQSSYAQAIIPNINSLASGLRAAGGSVAWVLPAPSPIRTVHEFYGETVARSYQASGGGGPLPSRVADGLAPDSGDIFAEKTAASAFFPGRCDLAQQIDQRNINTVLIAGTVADVCCASTARDASTLGYRTVMVADANAAGSDDVLNATLRTIYRSFGDVRSTEEILGLLH